MWKPVRKMPSNLLKIELSNPPENPPQGHQKKVILLLRFKSARIPIICALRNDTVCWFIKVQAKNVRRKSKEISCFFPYSQLTCEVFTELDVLLWTLSTVLDSSLPTISFTYIFFQIEEELEEIFVVLSSTREFSLYSQLISEEN